MGRELNAKQEAALQKFKEDIEREKLAQEKDGLGTDDQTLL